MVRTRFADMTVAKGLIGWKPPAWSDRRETRSAQGRKFKPGPRRTPSPAAQRRKRRSLARRKAA